MHNFFVKLLINRDVRNVNYRKCEIFVERQKRRERGGGKWASER